MKKQHLKDGDQDWETPCEVCGQKPTMHQLDYVDLVAQEKLKP